jgi:hypothetical protein
MTHITVRRAPVVPFGDAREREQVAVQPSMLRVPNCRSALAADMPNLAERTHRLRADDATRC